MSTQSPLSQAVASLSDTLSTPVYSPGGSAISTVSSAWLVKLIAAASRVVALSDVADRVVEPAAEPDTEVMTREAILAVAREALDNRRDVRAIIRFSPGRGLPDQTLLTRVSEVWDGSVPFITFVDLAADGKMWHHIFADQQDEGILTLEII